MTEPITEYPGMDDLRASISDLGDFAWADEDMSTGRVVLIVDREPDGQPVQRARVLIPSRQIAWDYLFVWRRTIERLLRAQRETAHAS
jgi:hypothetical protein